MTQSKTAETKVALGTAVGTLIVAVLWLCARIVAVSAVIMVGFHYLSQISNIPAFGLVECVLMMCIAIAVRYGSAIIRKD